MRDANAVSKGVSDMVTSTLATVVSMIATMKKVNMPAQHNPEIHSAAPPWRMRANTPRPCISGRITSRLSTVNRLRQKVTSNFCACSRWRVTTPAVDHIRVTAIISNTARL